MQRRQLNIGMPPGSVGVRIRVSIGVSLRVRVRTGLQFQLNAFTILLSNEYLNLRFHHARHLGVLPCKMHSIREISHESVGGTK